MKITVFGGASPLPGEQAYEDARYLGFGLGKEGHTVLTGGYVGTMEAVSQGAFEAGAHVIGVTCDEIESWRKRKANAWVKEEWHYPTLRERMYALIDHCDIAVALPGGVGTLAEIASAWNQLIINPTRTTHPLILVGPAWQKIFSDLFTEQTNYLHTSDQEIICFAADVNEALKQITLLAGSQQ